MSTAGDDQIDTPGPSVASPAVTQNRHTSAPLSASRATTWPRNDGGSPGANTSKLPTPPTPSPSTMTGEPKTTALGWSPIGVSQGGSPLARSSDTMRASNVPTTTCVSSTATDPPTYPPPRSWAHASSPVVASSARRWPVQSPVYTTPSDTAGVPLTPSRPLSSQAGARSATVSRSRVDSSATAR